MALDRAQLIAEGADLMRRAATIGRALSSCIAGLPMESATAYGERAAHLAVTGTLLGQSLSWLAEDRRADFSAPLMELAGHLRNLAERAASQGARTVPWDLMAIRLEVEAYHARVVRAVFDPATVLPFRQTQG